MFRNNYEKYYIRVFYLSHDIMKQYLFHIIEKQMLCISSANYVSFEKINYCIINSFRGHRSHFTDYVSE